jgi:hypothetical protein
MRCYRAGRRQSVKDCDAALNFGDLASPGSRGLIRDYEALGKPLVWVEPGLSRPSHIVVWLREAPYIKRLMIAGNRESRDPRDRGAGRAVSKRRLPISGDSAPSDRVDWLRMAIGPEAARSGDTRDANRRPMLAHPMRLTLEARVSSA